MGNQPGKEGSLSQEHAESLGQGQGQSMTSSDLSGEISSSTSDKKKREMRESSVETNTTTLLSVQPHASSKSPSTSEDVSRSVSPQIPQLLASESASVPASDSSTSVSSRRERRRFLKRNLEALRESQSLEDISRKVDKTDSRKSSLNSGEGGERKRESDEALISSDYDAGSAHLQQPNQSASPQLVTETSVQDASESRTQRHEANEEDKKKDLSKVDLSSKEGTPSQTQHDVITKTQSAPVRIPPQTTTDASQTSTHPGVSRKHSGQQSKQSSNQPLVQKKGTIGQHYLKRVAESSQQVQDLAPGSPGQSFGSKQQCKLSPSPHGTSPGPGSPSSQSNQSTDAKGESKMNTTMAEATGPVGSSGSPCDPVKTTKQQEERIPQFVDVSVKKEKMVNREVIDKLLPNITTGGDSQVTQQDSQETMPRATRRGLKHRQQQLTAVEDMLQPVTADIYQLPSSSSRAPVPQPDPKHERLNTPNLQEWRPAPTKLTTSTQVRPSVVAPNTSQPPATGDLLTKNATTSSSKSDLPKPLVGASQDPSSSSVSSDASSTLDEQMKQNILFHQKQYQQHVTKQQQEEQMKQLYHMQLKRESHKTSMDDLSQESKDAAREEQLKQIKQKQERIKQLQLKKQQLQQKQMQQEQEKQFLKQEQLKHHLRLGQQQQMGEKKQQQQEEEKQKQQQQQQQKQQQEPETQAPIVKTKQQKLDQTESTDSEQFSKTPQELAKESKDLLKKQQEALKKSSKYSENPRLQQIRQQQRQLKQEWESIKQQELQLKEQIEEHQYNIANGNKPDSSEGNIVSSDKKDILQKKADVGQARVKEHRGILKGPSAPADDSKPSEDGEPESGSDQQGSVIMAPDILPQNEIATSSKSKKLLSEKKQIKKTSPRSSVTTETVTSTQAKKGTKTAPIFSSDQKSPKEVSSEKTGSAIKTVSVSSEAADIETNEVTAKLMRIPSRSNQEIKRKLVNSRYPVAQIKPNQVEMIRCETISMEASKQSDSVPSTLHERTTVGGSKSEIHEPKKEKPQSRTVSSSDMKSKEDITAPVYKRKAERAADKRLSAHKDDMQKHAEKSKPLDLQKLGREHLKAALASCHASTERATVTTTTVSKTTKKQTSPLPSTVAMSTNSTLTSTSSSSQKQMQEASVSKTTVQKIVPRSRTSVEKMPQSKPKSTEDINAATQSMLFRVKPPNEPVKEALTSSLTVSPETTSYTTSNTTRKKTQGDISKQLSTARDSTSKSNLTSFAATRQHASSDLLQSATSALKTSKDITPTKLGEAKTSKEKQLFNSKEPKMPSVIQAPTTLTQTLSKALPKQTTGPTIMSTTTAVDPATTPQFRPKTSPNVTSSQGSAVTTSEIKTAAQSKQPILKKTASSTVAPLSMTATIDSTMVASKEPSSQKVAGVSMAPNLCTTLAESKSSSFSISETPSATTMSTARKQPTMATSPSVSIAPAVMSAVSAESKQPILQTSTSTAVAPALATATSRPKVSGGNLMDLQTATILGVTSAPTTSKSDPKTAGAKQLSLQTSVSTSIAPVPSVVTQHAKVSSSKPLSLTTTSAGGFKQQTATTRVASSSSTTRVDQKTSGLMQANLQMEAMSYSTTASLKQPSVQKSPVVSVSPATTATTAGANSTSTKQAIIQNSSSVSIGPKPDSKATHFQQSESAGSTKQINLEPIKIAVVHTTAATNIKDVTSKPGPTATITTSLTSSAVPTSTSGTHFIQTKKTVQPDKSDDQERLPSIKTTPVTISVQTSSQQSVSCEKTTPSPLNSSKTTSITTVTTAKSTFSKTNEQDVPKTSASADSVTSIITAKQQVSTVKPSAQKAISPPKAKAQIPEASRGGDDSKSKIVTTVSSRPSTAAQKVVEETKKPTGVAIEKAKSETKSEPSSISSSAPQGVKMSTSKDLLKDSARSQTKSSTSVSDTKVQPTVGVSPAPQLDNNKSVGDTKSSSLDIKSTSENVSEDQSGLSVKAKSDLQKQSVDIHSKRNISDDKKRDSVDTAKQAAKPNDEKRKSKSVLEEKSVVAPLVLESESQMKKDEVSTSKENVEDITVKKPEDLSGTTVQSKSPVSQTHVDIELVQEDKTMPVPLGEDKKSYTQFQIQLESNCSLDERSRSTEMLSASEQLKKESFKTEPQKSEKSDEQMSVRKRLTSAKNSEEELKTVLNRRSHYLDEWETQQLSLDDGKTSAEKDVDEYEQRILEDKGQKQQETHVVDQQLGSLLRARLEQTKLHVFENEPTSDSDSSRASPAPSALKIRGSSLEIEKASSPSRTAIKKIPSESSVTRFKKTAILQKCQTLGGAQSDSETVMTSSKGIKPEVTTQFRPKLQKSKTVDYSPSSGVDHELAQFLKARRENIDDDDDDEDQVKQKTTDDGRPKQRSPTPERDVEPSTVKRKSVAEILLEMETLQKDAGTPKQSDTTGSSTPKMRLVPMPFRSESVSPRPNLSQSLSDVAAIGNDMPALSDASVAEQARLLEKLKSVADIQDIGPTVADRRKKFQKSSRDDVRRRTQPVTMLEVLEADGLESVADFRAEIIRNTCTNAFQIRSEHERPMAVKKIKGQDSFPQPFRRQRLKDLRKCSRFKTQPITAEELKEVPETPPLSNNNLTAGEIFSVEQTKVVESSDKVTVLKEDAHDVISETPKDEQAGNDETAEVVSVSATATEPASPEIPETPETPSFLAEDSDDDLDDLVAINYREIIAGKQSSTASTKKIVPESPRTQPQVKPEPPKHPPTELSVVNKTTPGKDDDDEDDDPLSNLTLAEKMAKFQSLQSFPSKSKQESASSKRSFEWKKMRERAKTFTEGDVPKVMEVAKETSTSQPDVSAADQVQEGEEDELSKLSIAEKMKIFSAKKERRPEQEPKRVLRRDQARFRTQPITSDEVHKAKRLSGGGENNHHGNSTEGSGLQSGSPLRGITVKKMKDGDWIKHHKDAESSQSDSEKDTPTSEGKLQVSIHSSAKSQQETENLDITMDSKTSLKSAPPWKSSRTISKRSGSYESDAQNNLYQHETPQETRTTSGDVIGQKSETKSLRVDTTGSTSQIAVDETIADDIENESKPKTENGDFISATSGDTASVLGKSHSKWRSKDGSSTEEETPSAKPRIRNEAVARRRNQRERKQADRYLSQPVDANTVQDATDSSQSELSLRRAKSYGSHGRHYTQPVTTTEREEAESTDTAKKSSSIADRLASLQKRGEEDWKKRISKESSPDVKRVSNFSLSSKETSPEKHEVKLRDKSHLSGNARPRSIADRLTRLTEAQGDWMSKVNEKDVKQFTVEGKMEKRGTYTNSPLVKRTQQTPRKPLCRESESSEAGPSVPTSPTSDVPLETSPQPQSPSTPSPKLRRRVTPKRIARTSQAESQSTETAKSMPNLGEVNKDDEEDEGPKTVTVPQPDEEELSLFFDRRSSEELAAKKVEVTVDDFDHIFMESEDIIMATRKLKPNRTKAASSRNPLKQLAQRDDLQTEYTEVKTDVAEREMRRIKRDQYSSTAGLAQEALAGLASRENFSRVSLRKTDSFKGMPGEKFVPYKDLMLIQIKGRRQCHARLVEPIPESINSGDAFVLVTSDKVFTWFGEFCNVIEKAKATEVAAIIHQKKDLGCKAAREPIIVDEKKHGYNTENAFWKTLGGHKEYAGPGPNEEDEIYEDCMTLTNIVYRVVGSELEPVDEFWGKPLKHELLKESEAFVLDFGSELYIWSGKRCSFEKRKVAVKKAQELWDEGFDYEECDINPIWPLQETGERYPLKNSKRPEWALCAKVNQNMETILFREKFIDWPDPSRLIGIKAMASEMEAKIEELRPYDAKLMVEEDKSPVSMVLEGSHVGRGERWIEMIDGLRKEYEISTLNVTVWHASEYEHSKLDETSHGQFHEGDTYVIRWHYMVTQTGFKTLKGDEARRSVTGRERHAYFFWQGCESSVTDKGASALMTVELDAERGPQIRVEQGKEPPCFLNLFKGHMIVHQGKRFEDEYSNPWRLYIVRNELPSEAYLLQVPCKMSSLRSRASFVFVHTKTGLCYLWHGRQSSCHARSRASELASKLKKNTPIELGLHPNAHLVVQVMEEGCEKSDFWIALNSRDRSVYHSIDTETDVVSSRLFYMTSVSGQFESKEILNPCRNYENITMPFAFLQTDLYSHPQPALLLLDTGSEVYLWQGYWPEQGLDGENSRTGSAEARFSMNRKCAMHTTLSYCNEISLAKPRPAFMVFAGLEPLHFTNLFPQWKVDETARESNEKEGRVYGEHLSVSELLTRLQKTHYTLAELQERPLPEGVHPLKLETYLNDDEFETVLGMNRDEFGALPTWKQKDLKKDAGLF